MIRYLFLQWILFLLKYINKIIILTFGYSLFSGRVKDEKLSGQRFECCAHRVKIMARAKQSELGPCSLNNFLAFHSRYEDPRISILKNDDVILINLDKNGATFGLFPGLGPIDVVRKTRTHILKFNHRTYLCSQITLHVTCRPYPV